MSTQTDTVNPDIRRRNVVRTTWVLVAFVAVILITSIPFWKGLHQIAINSGL